MQSTIDGAAVPAFTSKIANVATFRTREEVQAVADEWGIKEGSYFPGGLALMEDNE